MTVCVGVYPDNMQLGPAAGGPPGFITQPGIPIAYMKSGACSGAEVTLYTQQEVDDGRLKPQEMSAQDVQDRMDLFWLLVLALVSVWGIKQILRLFTGDTDRG